MAIKVLDDVAFTWNAVDLSDHSTRATIVETRARVPATAFGDAAEKFEGGLYSWEVQVQLNNDEASASVMQTLRPDFLSKTPRSFFLRPDKSDVQAATNPNYTNGFGLIVDIT